MALSTTMTLAFASLTVLFILLLFPGMNCECRFPENFYETKEDDWIIRSEDGSLNNNGYKMRDVTFKDSMMKVEDIVQLYPEKIVNRTKRYICEEVYTAAEMTYIISVTEAGKEQLYTCVQFVIRDHYVIQWRMAPLNKDRVSPQLLCFDAGDRMKLIDSPFIYFPDTFWKEKREKGFPYMACPLVGGYTVTSYQDESGQERCNSSVIPMMKVEFECESGDGFKIEFPQRNEKAMKQCPYPYGEKWELFCMAHWTHGPWTFMVVRDEYGIDTKRVCMRYPTSSGNSLTLDISMVAICDTSESFEQSNYRYRMNLIKYPVKSLCDNQYPSCENIKKENEVKACREWQSAENCPETCSACPENVDVFTQNEATFPSHFIGHWLKDTHAQGQENVTIEAKFITIPSLGKYRLLKEADCWTFTSLATVRATEYVFLRYFDNGCSPRVTTMLFANHSSSVISFRVSYPNYARAGTTSENVTGPFMYRLKDTSQDWCAQNRYRLSKRNQVETFRTAHFNWFTLVNPNQDAETVSCPVYSYIFTVTTPDGSSCNAHMKQTLQDAFQVTYTYCNNATQSEILPPPPTEFKCLADYADAASRRFVITRVKASPKALVKEDFICWVFSPTSKNTIYWMRSSECDSSSGTYADLGVRDALAKVEYQEPDLTSKGTSLKLSVTVMVCALFLKVLMH